MTENKDTFEAYTEITEPCKVELVVDGCKVTLKFSEKMDAIAISEVKQMMLSGIVKA